MLLCRMGRWKFLRAVPLGLAAAMAALGFYYGQQPGLGESLFGVILLLGSISPAVGAVLAWAAWACVDSSSGVTSMDNVIYIVFSSTPTGMGRLIRLATRNQYNHVPVL